MVCQTFWLIKYELSAIDCEWDQWTEFGECDKACGPGFRHRTRGKKTEADFGGQECTGDATEQVK